MPRSMLHRSNILLINFLLAFVLVSPNTSPAQSAAVTSPADNAENTVVLPSHHPQWANPENDLGPLAPNSSLDSLTVVLSRSPQQEQAFRQFLADQQNPASPSYHHWLTPDQVGARFGLSRLTSPPSPIGSSPRVCASRG